jgi:hypothetical protein
LFLLLLNRLLRMNIIKRSIQWVFNSIAVPIIRKESKYIFNSRHYHNVVSSFSMKKFRVHWYFNYFISKLIYRKNVIIWFITWPIVSNKYPNIIIISFSYVNSYRSFKSRIHINWKSITVPCYLIMNIWLFFNTFRKFDPFRILI